MAAAGGSKQLSATELRLLQSSIKVQRSLLQKEETGTTSTGTGGGSRGGGGWGFAPSSKHVETGGAGMMHPVASFASTDASGEVGALSPGEHGDSPGTGMTPSSTVDGGGGQKRTKKSRRENRFATLADAEKRAVVKDVVASASDATPAMRVAAAKSTKPQHFDYFMVVDVEATCEENSRTFPNEIIEWPVILVDVATRQVVSEFREYVRPVKHPKLSRFCTELTGITQAQVDSARTLPEVLSSFIEWYEANVPEGKRAIFASDGPWDLRHFVWQCHVARDGLVLPGPIALWKVWINIRKTYSIFFKTRPLNLGQMLTRQGLDFVGRQHCGLDDARNIARLAIVLLTRGCVFGPQTIMRIEEKDLTTARQAAEIEAQCAAEAAGAGIAKAKKKKSGEGSSKPTTPTTGKKVFPAAPSSAGTPAASAKVHTVAPPGSVTGVVDDDGA